MKSIRLKPMFKLKSFTFKSKSKSMKIGKKFGLKSKSRLEYYSTTEIKPYIINVPSSLKSNIFIISASAKQLSVHNHLPKLKKQKYKTHVYNINNIKQNKIHKEI